MKLVLITRITSSLGNSEFLSFFSESKAQSPPLSTENVQIIDGCGVICEDEIGGFDFAGIADIIEKRIVMQNDSSLYVLFHWTSHSGDLYRELSKKFKNVANFSTEDRNSRNEGKYQLIIQLYRSFPDIQEDKIQSVVHAYFGNPLSISWDYVACLLDTLLNVSTMPGDLEALKATLQSPKACLTVIKENFDQNIYLNWKTKMEAIDFPKITQQQTWKMFVDSLTETNFREKIQAFKDQNLNSES